jgi:hypothetical protein
MYNHVYIVSVSLLLVSDLCNLYPLMSQQSRWPVNTSGEWYFFAYWDSLHFPSAQLQHLDDVANQDFEMQVCPALYL